LIVNPETYVGKVSSIPTRNDVSIPVEEHLIVELYSK
jgi:ribosomal protein S4